MPEPTPYPEVNATLLQLKNAVQEILGEQFTGLYLYGSLALGDFDPLKSDIDFVVVTEEELNEGQLQALQAMHARFVTSGSRWAAEMEGSYLPRAVLHRYNPDNTHHPHIDRGNGQLQIEQHDTDWIVQRFCLREYGVTVSGPPVRELIDPISAGELRQAVRDLMWWWELQLSDTQRIERSGYQAYTVLSLCRVLYTLETGDITSKPKAAEWARRHLPARWTPLIERALNWQPGEEMDRLQETMALIRYVISTTRPI